MKTIPMISKYMTVTPVTAGKHVSIAEAGKMMKDKNFRHLPILDGGKVIGVLSDRDIKAFSGLKGVDLEKETVEQVCITDPYVVSPSAKLDEVCAYMAENKFGSVIIEDNKKIVGIFTWVDALRAVSDLLETRLKK